MKTARLLFTIIGVLMMLSVNVFAATVSMPSATGGHGSTVDIPVSIDDATGVAGYQFTVTYNPAVLKCTDALNGSLISGWDTPTVNPTVSNEIATLSIGPTLTGSSGTLATLTCTVVGASGTSTSLHFVPFPGTDVVDEFGDTIPAAYADGSFTVNNACTQTNGGVEICDGIDNDCDGTVDLDTLNCTQPLALTTCTATLQLPILHFPILLFQGQAYEVDFTVDLETLSASADTDTAKPVSDMATFTYCTPSSVSDTLSLHVPSVTFENVLYWGDAQWTEGVTFMITGVGQQYLPN